MSLFLTTFTVVVSGMLRRSVSDCATVNEGDDVPAVQAFLDGSTNVTQDGTPAAPVTLPAGLDTDGDNVVGADYDSWSDGWTVGLGSGS